MARCKYCGHRLVTEDGVVFCEACWREAKKLGSVGHDQAGCRERDPAGLHGTHRRLPDGRDLSRRD
jgi:uncharacterized Zn finger protein (UPF0148 family)